VKNGDGTMTMTNESAQPLSPAKGMKSTQVYGMAVICLLIGVALGYLFRGSESHLVAPSKTAANTMPQSAPATASVAPTAATPQKMPSLDEMKHMADAKAAPLLEKLKADPNNPSLLNQVGLLYRATHQFKEAAAYFQKMVEVDPKNLTARTELASCLYYQGDVDGAIRQLQQGLQYDPKDANSLFNLGVIRWEGKKDSKGAVSAWKQLLKSNPKLADDKKAAVEKLIAQAQQPHGNVNN
jgi:cytochrome c-type biogenesis protein CcmH/NrfG